MWYTYAFLAAFFASLVSIFGKLGLKTIDPTQATAVRGVIMAILVVIISVYFGKFENFSFSSLSGKEWIYIFLAGLAGALSWLAFFFALAHGGAGPVNAIDKLSIVFTIILAGIFLGESLNTATIAGAVLISIGAVLVAVPFETLETFFSSLFG